MKRFLKHLQTNRRCPFVAASLASRGPVILFLLLVLSSTLVAEDFLCVTNNGAITITKYVGPGGLVTIPDQISGLPVTAIGYGAWTRANSPTLLKLGANLVSIGEGAFGGCASLTNIIFAGALDTIGPRAFSSCTALPEITIPSSVTRVDDSAFFGCTALIRATIGRNVQTIEAQAFTQCYSLTNISVDPLNSSYSSLEGVLCNKDQTALVQFPPGKASLYEIPAGIAQIGQYAFAQCTSLKNLTLPTTLTNIQKFAFDHCTTLADVVFPNTLRSLGFKAFQGCTSMRNVVLPDGMISTGGAAFYECSGITNISLPATLLNVGSGELYGCSSLTQVTIPAGMTNLGDSAFCNCTNLAKLHIPDSVTTIQDYAFYNCSSLTNLTIPPGVDSIETYTFRNCVNLEGLYFKGNAPAVASIYAFKESARLTIYHLPGSMGWGAYLAARPTLVWNPEPQLDDGAFGIRTNVFGFPIRGTPNIPIVVETSTNSSSHDWIPLQRCTLTNGSIYFADSEWINHPARFYRIRSP